MVNFATWVPGFIYSFISSDHSICSTVAFSALGNSGHIFVTISIDFSSNSKGDALFLFTTCDYSCTDCDSLRDHLGDGLWKNIFHLAASADGTEFCE